VALVSKHGLQRLEEGIVRLAENKQLNQGWPVKSYYHNKDNRKYGPGEARKREHLEPTARIKAFAKKTASALSKTCTNTSAPATIIIPTSEATQRSPKTSICTSRRTTRTSC